MEFEELKVEVPVDDGEKDEKDFSFNMVIKRQCTPELVFIICFNIQGFLLYFALQERRYENKSGCFVTGFDVTSKVSLSQYLNHSSSPSCCSIVQNPLYEILIYLSVSISESKFSNLSSNDRVMIRPIKAYFDSSLFQVFRSVWGGGGGGGGGVKLFPAPT